MTYHFLCGFFKPKIAAWLTAIWFGLLLVTIFIFSVYGEDAFVYKNF